MLFKITDFKTKGNLNRVFPSPDFSSKSFKIIKRLLEIIDYYKPEEAAIEQVFTAKNALTALKLGQARGVAVAACANFDIPIFDYVPTSVKKALVGVGRADKEQVAFMIGKILNVNVKRFRLDTTDALGVAVCHSSMRRFYSLTSK